MAEVKDKLRYRDATITPSADSNGEYNDVVLSTELPVKTYDDNGNPYYEILDYSPQARVNLERFNPSVPLLDSHRTGLTDILGRVISPRVEDRALKANIKLGETLKSQQIREQIDTGNLTSLSIGYVASDEKREGTHKGLPLVRAMSHEIYETSLVSMPANVEAKIRNSTTNEVATMVDEVKSEDSSENKTPDVKVRDNSNQVPMQERVLQAAASATAAYKGAIPLAREMLTQDSKTSVDQYFTKLSERMKESEESDDGIDLKSRQSFSFVNLINHLAEPGDAVLRKRADMELQICQAARERATGELAAKGQALIPGSVLRTRTIDGDNLMQESFGDFISYARESSKIMPLCTPAPNLQGTVVLPRQSGTGSVRWVPNEAGDTVDGSTDEVDFDQVSLPQKSLAARQVYSRNTMINSTPAIEQLVRADLAGLFAEEMDRVILGNGGTNQPDGVYKTMLPANKIAATAPKKLTWAYLCQLEEKVATQKVLSASNVFVMNPTMVSVGRQVLRNANSPDFLVNNAVVDPASGQLMSTVLNYRLISTTVVSDKVSSATSLTGGTGNVVYFGDFSQMVVGSFGSSGLSIMVDPYTLSTTRRYRVSAFAETGLANRRPSAFAAVWDLVGTA